MEAVIYPSKVQGTMPVPPSKSLAHRAVICASLARGLSRLSNVPDSIDLKATIGCMQAMGAQMSFRDGVWLIRGFDPLNVQGPLRLNCEESGSTLRFLIPIAALSEADVAFSGQGRLLERPMGIYADLFLSQHLRFVQGAKAIDVRGPLQGGLFEIPGNVSSQFISGLLLALPLQEKNSAIAVLPPYESRSYTDLTVSTLRRFGAVINEPTDEGYEIPGGQHYKATCLQIEGDYSQFAFPAVLAALCGEITCTGLAPDSLQGDRVIVDLLEKAGAEVSREGETITVRKAALQGQEIDLADCPDLGPILCVLAAYSQGTTRIFHAARLRLKESDRIAAMEEELKKWGVEISSDEDSITITGKPAYKRTGVVVDGHNDHRIVMAMTVFALAAENPSAIQGCQAVRKSWPDFFSDLKKVKAKVSVKE